MITRRRSAERGHANHGWLDARHTFSFAQFMDPDFMGFGHLRVLNQDRIQPGQGFPTHPHRDMEIITYVLSGVLEHRDSMGNGSRIVPGDVQYMSAGSGVLHSEFNASQDEELHLLQMWVLPAKAGGEPAYGQEHFSAADRRNQLRLVASPDGELGSIRIRQDTRVYASLVDPAAEIVHPLDPNRRAWLHVARGAIELDGERLDAGDGAGIQELSEIRIVGVEPAELVLFDLA